MLVVTGASGLLGACVWNAAIEQGQETVGVCRHHGMCDPAARIVAIDLTDAAATRKLLLELRPDAIVHCAAATNVDWCEDHVQEANAINVEAPAVIADAAARLNARLIYVSTDAVFDGKKGGYVEGDEPAPVNAYARSKLAGERETLRRHPSAAVVRVNIYGWNAQEKESLAEWVLGRLEEGGIVRGFEDVFFTPMLVNDLATILFAMLQQKLSGLYHVTGSERLTKLEFARRVATIFGLDPERVTPCQVDDMKLRAARPRDISLNTEKIALALGRGMPDVESGLREFRALRERRYPERLKALLGARKSA